MDVYYMWKGTMYSEKPKFTEIKDTKVEDGITYHVVKRISFIPVLLLLLIFVITVGIYYEFVNYDEVYHTVNYHTTLYCDNGELQLNISNNVDNEMDMIISLYDSKEILIDAYVLRPGECIGNIQVNTEMEAGSSSIYTLEFEVSDAFTTKNEKVETLVVFN
ncbi:MAG: hypothetical protein IJE43_19180 [Alphaproteobacteria bacterium]|nr:hypothetical protein [Alphaproteobacteria bacterium]